MEEIIYSHFWLRVLLSTSFPISLNFFSIFLTSQINSNKSLQHQHCVSKVITLASQLQDKTKPSSSIKFYLQLEAREEIYLRTTPALTAPGGLVIILMTVLVNVINYKGLQRIAFHLVMCMRCPDQLFIMIIKAAKQLSWMPSC